MWQITLAAQIMSVCVWNVFISLIVSKLKKLFLELIPCFNASFETFKDGSNPIASMLELL